MRDEIRRMTAKWALRAYGRHWLDSGGVVCHSAETGAVGAAAVVGSAKERRLDTRFVLGP